MLDIPMPPMLCVRVRAHLKLFSPLSFRLSHLAPPAECEFVPATNKLRNTLLTSMYHIAKQCRIGRILPSPLASDIDTRRTCTYNQHILWARMCELTRVCARVYAFTTERIFCTANIDSYTRTPG